MATVPPRSSARSAATTTSPDGANVIAASSGHGGRSSVAAGPRRAERERRARGRSPSACRRRRRSPSAAPPAARCGPRRRSRRGPAATPGCTPATRSERKPMAPPQSSGRGRDVVEALGRSQREVGPHHELLGEAAVDVPAREARLRAQVLAALPAARADAARAREPRDAGALARPPAVDARAHRRHDADRLVARHDRQPVQRPGRPRASCRSVRQTAHAPTRRSELARPGRRVGQLDEPQRAARPPAPVARGAARAPATPRSAAARGDPRGRAVALQHLGHGDAAVLLLVRLEHGDDRARRRSRRCR